jgi:hypothetical protein
VIAVTLIGMRTREHLAEVVRDAVAPALTADEMSSLIEVGRQ